MPSIASRDNDTKLFLSLSDKRENRVARAPAVWMRKYKSIYVYGQSRHCPKHRTAPTRRLQPYTQVHFIWDMRYCRCYLITRYYIDSAREKRVTSNKPIHCQLDQTQCEFLFILKLSYTYRTRYTKKLPAKWLVDLSILATRCCHSTPGGQSHGILGQPASSERPRG